MAPGLGEHRVVWPPGRCQRWAGIMPLDDCRGHPGGAAGGVM